MINFTDEDEIKAAFVYFRNHGFPYPKMHMHQIINTFRRLQKATAKINKEKRRTLLGTSELSIEIQPVGDVFLVNYFHPHIWESKAVGKNSPVESFHNDKFLFRALSLTLKYKDKIPLQGPKQIFLSIVSGTQMSSNFRPTATKAMYNYFKAHNVLDMCAGYGGSLLGFLASKAKGKYWGVDPSSKTQDCNRKMAITFNSSERVNLFCGPFEDLKQSELPKNQIDLAFTSPPYFQNEIYDEESKTQSRERYKEYNSWLENFLRVLFQKTKPTLKKKGKLAMNIMDVNVKKKRYPLVNDTLRIAEEEGYKLTQQIQMKLISFGKGLDKRKAEPIFVFKKG